MILFRTSILTLFINFLSTFDDDQKEKVVEEDGLGKLRELACMIL
jgi:hypothetical protein